MPTDSANGPSGLAVLEQQVLHDLETLAYPFKPWRPDRQKGGRYDVVIIGAGQAGVSIAAGLKQNGVDNILVIDKAPYGQEGPWSTFARMPTLRSPKYLTGPDLGIASLTMRAWYEAQWGRAAWETLDKIPTNLWPAYLLWFRHVLALPVRNECTLENIQPRKSAFELTVSEKGVSHQLSTKKVVLCTGVDGTGNWHIPPAVRENLSKDRYDHASNPDIEFFRFVGKRVAVLGAGASAFDQAAAALEQGAQTVYLFTRRDALHAVQPYKHLEKSGFLNGFATLPDLWRWRFMRHILTLREPPPKETVERVSRHANFKLVVAAPWHSIREDQTGVHIETEKGTFDVDHVICGTGFTVDLSLRPELAALAPHIALWKDRFSPPAGEESEMLAQYPYLGTGFEFQEKSPGAAPFLRDIHLFTFGSTLSSGFSGGGMNGLKFTLPKLINAIVGDLFSDDVKRHYTELLQYDTVEFDTDSIDTL